MTTLDWFLRSVDAHPDEVALKAGGEELTYARLNTWSAAIAAVVEGVVSGRRPVALAVSRKPSTYAAYLAILRCGVPVVPFDPDQPAERNRRAIELSRACVVLTDRDAEAVAAPVPVVVIPEETTAELLRPRQAGSDIAYVLFTSGSTGTPKGIPIGHGQIEAFVRHNIARYGVGPGSRLSQTFGLTFDPSVFDLFVAWGSGATLVVPTREQLLDPVRFVNDEKITHWYSVPALISAAQMTGSLAPGSMPSLSWSLFAGEQLTLDAARSWARAAPGSTVENLYGPTELTVTVTAYRLPPDEQAWPRTSNGTVPIGAVYPHLSHRVDAATGELQVRGAQRFEGYLDPGDNADRFSDDDGTTLGSGAQVRPDHWYRTGDKVAIEDGQLVHLGRLDMQVKIGGQRVELGDIESAIRDQCGLADVVVIPAGGTGQVLTAIYTGQEASSAELRGRLRGHLPAHMIPKRFVPCARLPLNPNGKIDRVACAAL